MYTVALLNASGRGDPAECPPDIVSMLVCVDSGTAEWGSWLMRQRRWRDGL